ncbi:hypothetical protein ACQ4PT_015389 [Festuca glaucescens]
MWQSCLRRSLPPLLSHLRCTWSPLRSSILPSGSASRTLSLSRAAHSPPVAPGTWPHFCDGCGTDQLLQRRWHLYLALDDWEEGFSLHKIGLDDVLAGSGDDSGDELRRLPYPILRLGFRTLGSHPRFHALGSNIVVTNDSSSHQGNGLTLVYDTDTAALGIENSVQPELRGQYKAVAAGDNLYTLDSHNINNGDLPYLCQTVPDHIPRSNFDTDEKEDMPYCRRPQRRWSWERLPAPPPFTSGNRSHVSARTLHPDGRTVFVSFESSDYGKDMGTFSLDTDSGEWTRRGDCKEDGCGYDYLCTCDVPDISKDSVARKPAWSVAKEKLTFLEAPLKTLGHVLLPIGGGSGVFCLVEPAVRQGFTYKSFLGDGDKCLLRVTMFRAKYGRKGQLVAAPLHSGYFIDVGIVGFGQACSGTCPYAWTPDPLGGAPRVGITAGPGPLFVGTGGQGGGVVPAFCTW